MQTATSPIASTAIAAAAAIMASPAAASAMAGGFDLAYLEDLPSAEVPIERKVKLADGRELVMKAFVTLAGPEHPLRKAWVFAKQRKNREAFMATGKLHSTDPEEDAREELELLISCVLDWRDIKVNGVDLPCTPENVRQWLTDPARAWFKSLVQAAFSNSEAFTATSAPN